MANPENNMGAPRHQSSRVSAAWAAVVGAVGGIALFAGVAYWYFHGVEKPAPPLPGQPLNSGSGQASGGPVVDFTVFDIEPLAEMHLKVVDGEVESIDVPPDSGLSATLDGKSIGVKAGNYAKEGAHKLKVRGPKGKETVLTVNVKKKK